MIKYKLAAAAVLIPQVLSAQDDINTRNEIAILPSAGYFFLALIAGLILAFAFQLLLTNLSVAAGLSMLKNATNPNRIKQPKKHYRKTADHAQAGFKEDSRDTHNEHKHEPGEYNREYKHEKRKTGRKINSIYGAWTMITAAITMFAAGWLAGEMSLTYSVTMGAILGLSIWGLFYIATTYLEIKAVSSLVGSITKLAVSGLRISYGAASSLLARSPEKKMVKASARIARSVKRELFKDIDPDEVRTQLEKMINHIKPPQPEPEEIAREFAKVLNHTEIRAIVNHEGPMYEQDTIVASLQTNGMGKKKAENIVHTVNEVFTKIKEETSIDKDNVSKIADTVMRIAGMSDSEAHQKRETVESYLRNTGNEDLNPEAIKQDIELLVKHPKEGFSSLGHRLAHIDRNTVAKILAQRKDMNEEEARKMVDKVFDTFQTLGSNIKSTKESILNKLSAYLNSLERPELNYEGVRQDMKMLIFEDRKAGADAMMKRLKAVDRDTLKAIIASRKDISDEEAERIINKIEQTRDKMLDRVMQIRNEANRRVYMAKRAVIRQADNVRSTAANAAWWAFSTATVSGVAAVIGGILAANTGFRVIP